MMNNANMWNIENKNMEPSEYGIRDIENRTDICNVNK